MAIELVTKYLPYVDELFAAESKKSLLTNNDFDWTGAHLSLIHILADIKFFDKLQIFFRCPEAYFSCLLIADCLNAWIL